MASKRRHSWTKPARQSMGDQTCTCLKCGLIRSSSGYDLERVYRWEGPPVLRWRERAPACPPDLATGVDIVAKFSEGMADEDMIEGRA
jgi:hypothetical protein